MADANDNPATDDEDDARRDREPSDGDERTLRDDTDVVQKSSEDSFPASDPPSYWADAERERASGAAGDALEGEAGGTAPSERDG